MELNTPFQFEPRPGLVCAGQPDAAGFQQAAAAGVKAVLNLRPDAEMEWDEASYVRELGMDYWQMPVATPADLNADNARQLAEWLNQHADEPVIVHCASSNRVGALLALAQAQAGASTEEALAFGRSAGLTKLEPVVQQLLQQESK